MHWERICGPGRGEWLRGVVLQALGDAYDENCQRYAPDDLGDNALTFGVAVSQNLRFLLDRALADTPGMEVIRPRNSFAVVIDGRCQLHFYKAPPTVFDLRALRFDSSATQLELVAENTEQLAFRFSGGVHGELEEDPPGHVVVVHFGDPFEGLHRADIGAPISSPTDGLQWKWTECLSDPALPLAQPWEEHEPPSDTEDDDLGLRLRDDQDDAETGMSNEPSG